MLKLSPTTCLIVCCLGLAVPPALHAQAPMQQLGSAEPAAPAPAPVPDSSTPQQDEATASALEGTDRAALPPNRAELAARQGRAFIAHVPRGSAPLDDVRLKLDVRGADLAGEIRVYYRPLIEPSALARHVVVQRDASGYSAQIPSHEVSAPGLSYWIVERMPDGSERAVFASSADPAPLHVELPAIESRERRLLSENGGRRSAATLRGEWVDLGGFKVRPENAASRQRDSYYLLEAQYAYSYFRIVDELEFAFGHLRGDILDQDTLDRRDKVGLDYGRSALTLALGDWFRVRAGVLLGVSTKGFETGVELAMIVGDRRGTQLSLDGSYVSGIGGKAGTRLGWATIRRVPMGARVEITNFPTNDQLGVRLLFDVSYQITPALLVRFDGGYRGRTSLAGGPSLALALRYGF